MKVAVLGSSGFIGSHVVDQFRADGVITVGIDIKDPIWSEPDQSLMVDVRDRSCLSRAIGKAEPDALVNLAGILGTSETFDCPEDAISVNMAAAANALLMCRDRGIPYIGVDTGNSWLNPYSITKRAASDLALAYCKAFGMRVTILKIFNAYGPRQSGTGPVEKIVPRFVHNAIHGIPLPVHGDGKQLIDLVWVGDCALSVARCIDRAPGNGEIIEVGSGSPISVNDVAERIMAQIGGGTINYLLPRRGEGEARTAADTRNCRDILGVLPDTSLQPLVETIAWYQERAYSSV